MRTGILALAVGGLLLACGGDDDPQANPGAQTGDLFIHCAMAGQPTQGAAWDPQSAVYDRCEDALNERGLLNYDLQLGNFEHDGETLLFAAVFKLRNDSGQARTVQTHIETDISCAEGAEPDGGWYPFSMATHRVAANSIVEIFAEELECGTAKSRGHIRALVFTEDGSRNLATALVHFESH